MIIVKLMGGLGNQLQQYALYRKYIELGIDARIDLSWFDESVQKNMLAKRSNEIDRFEGVDYKVCTDEERKLLIGSDSFLGKIKRKLKPESYKKYTETRIYDSELLSLDDKYLEGYFACEYYYIDIIDNLRKEFILPEKKDLDDIVSKINDCNSVSIHLRRGDYLDDINRAIFGNICTDEYYDSAIKYIIDSCDDVKPTFFVFSDDASYADGFKDEIKNKYGVEAFCVDINDGEDSCYDIYLMSLCKHNICANSTFSFWGARLNDYDKKIMIRPTIQKNTQTFDAEMMHELWTNWIFISPGGEVC